MRVMSCQCSCTQTMFRRQIPRALGLHAALRCQSKRASRCCCAGEQIPCNLRLCWSVEAFQQCRRPAAARDQLVLGIESSCDDTGVAVVNSSGQVLGEALATQVGRPLLTVLCNRLSEPCALQPGADSPHTLAAMWHWCLQSDIHAPWGGVVPTLAMEAHTAAMDGTVAEALRMAGVQPADLDAVAVSIGPGLSMCLRVGA